MSPSRDRSVVRSSVILSAKYCCSGSLLRLLKGSTTIDRRGATGGEVDAVDEAFASGTPTAPSKSKDPNRPCDVPDALLAIVFEGVIEPVAHLIANDAADTDPARLRERLQTRREVHPVAENIMLFRNYVAEVDADAEPDAPSSGTSCSRSATPRWISTAHRTPSTTL